MTGFYVRGTLTVKGLIESYFIRKAFYLLKFSSNAANAHFKMFNNGYTAIKKMSTICDRKQLRSKYKKY